MTTPSPSSRNILFCASDPGGARNLAPVAALLQIEHPVIALCSKQTLGIFAEHGLSTAITEVTDLETASTAIVDANPCAVVVGTSAADRPDALLTQSARAVGTPTIAVLDEWYYYAARFADADGTFTHLPDVICCQDELARKEAVAEGIPHRLLHITGSPALSERFTRLQNSIAAEDELGKTAIPTIIFVSEQIAKAFGKAPGESGFIGPFIGYNEKTVRAEIARVLSDYGMPCRVLEKLHPNETGTIEPPPHGSDVEWNVMVKDTSLLDAMQHADAVIGMRSIALLEAAMMGFRPASYQPNRIGPDQCTAARLGLAANLSTLADLKDWSKSAISGQQRRVIEATPPGFATPDAAKNICDVIMACIARNIEEQGISD